VRHAKVIATGAEIASGGQPGGNDATVANPMFPAGFAGDPADFTMTNEYETWYENATLITGTTNQPAAFHSANAPSDGGGYSVSTSDAGSSINFAPDIYDWSGNNLVIVSALDGFDYADATALVDRAVASDGTFPTAELLCMQGADSSRGARDPECEYATRALADAGLPGVFVTPYDGNLSGHTVAAYFTGSASLSGAIAGNTYVPGAMTDNLTSYGAAISNFFCNADGGTCPASESQTSIARFVRAGATGAHGTVNEPLNNSFPNAGALLLYTFGYSMGESYFFNQRFLYWQNIYLGDPLATPYATRPTVTIGDAGGSHPQNVPITVHATHPAGVASLTLYDSGRQVAQANADTVDYVPTESVGASLDLLAVAVANDAPVTRAGWAVPQQQPHAQVQGWLSATVTLGSDVASSEPSGDDGGGADAGPGDASADGGHDNGDSSGGSSGCGCRQAPAGASGGAAAIGLVALLLRRRRGAA
jgi:MYXO-CTERM domain-containing protein